MIESPRLFPKLHLLMGVHEVHDETSEMSRETGSVAVKRVLQRLGFPEGMHPLRGILSAGLLVRMSSASEPIPKEGGIPAFAGEAAVLAEET